MALTSRSRYFEGMFSMSGMAGCHSDYRRVFDLSYLTQFGVSVSRCLKYVGMRYGGGMGCEHIEQPDLNVTL